jgi:hypothetical protein
LSGRNIEKIFRTINYIMDRAGKGVCRRRNSIRKIEEISGKGTGTFKGSTGRIDEGEWGDSMEGSGINSIEGSVRV